MANAKETPRQKMISLMYLVLIAMLALQVSSTVIFKFEQLNENLELSNKETKGNNEAKLGKIGIEVKSKNNPGKQLNYLNTADEIRKKTASISTYMEELKKELIEETGGYDADGNLKGAKEETKVEVIMLGASQNGKGYELKEKLDNHIDWLNKQGFGTFEQIALDAEHHPIYKNKKDQANRDFADLNFANAPLVATLATISELENSILGMERIVLGIIGDSINLQEYKVGELIPMVKTSSNYVVAGKKYEAEMFLTAQLATEKPEMYFGDQKITIDENGMGKINFNVSGGNFGSDGTLKKKWTGKINVKKPNGTDTTYIVEQEYIVAKPSLQFQAASVQALYANCGNKMNLSVPELGLEFNPSYQVTGGRLEKGSTRGSMTLLPTAQSMNVKVSSDGVYLGEQRFPVKKIPLPRIELHCNGRLVDPVNGITISDLNNMVLKVIPDADFKEFLPDDARYRITKWTVILANGKKRKGNPLPGSGNQLKLRGQFPTPESGYRFIIDIEELQRMNYRGETEVVKLPQASRIHTAQIN